MQTGLNLSFITDHGWTWAFLSGRKSYFGSGRIYLKLYECNLFIVGSSVLSAVYIWDPELDMYWKCSRAIVMRRVRAELVIIFLFFCVSHFTAGSCLTPTRLSVQSSRCVTSMLFLLFLHSLFTRHTSFTCDFLDFQTVDVARVGLYCYMNCHREKISAYIVTHTPVQGAAPACVEHPVACGCGCWLSGRWAMAGGTNRTAVTRTASLPPPFRVQTRAEGERGTPR